jgi:hypothetical protein
MRNFSFVTVVSSTLAVMAIGLAVPAMADAASGSNVPTPAPVYPQTFTGGPNPYTSYRIDPYVPFGASSQR